MSGYRFYTDLAPMWPLISPVGDYEEEASFIASLVGQTEIPGNHVLDLGSGGGHNANHLKRQFNMTLVDLSPEMLAMSRQLNPECIHHVGDMRTVRLNTLFDAVLIHDAVDYMTTEADLALALATAHVHCRPGGIALFMPDFVSETYQPHTNCGGSDTSDGDAVHYLEWSHERIGTTVLTDYVFALKRADAPVEIVHETHETGIFAERTWLDLLDQAGFDARVIDEVTTEDRAPRRLFVAEPKSSP